MNKPLTDEQIDAARQILLRAADADPRGYGGLADKFKAAGVKASRTTLYGFAAGKYKANPSNIARKVIAVLGSVACPFLERDIPATECAAYAARTYGAIDATQVPHWRACRRCSK